MRESVFMDIPVPSEQQMEKLKSLKKYIRNLGSVAVAFSSGVDSTFLLKVAHEELGDRCIAVTAMSCSFPKRELEEAKAFCQREDIRHIVVESEELEIEGFNQNPKNRCYLCKRELFEKIGQIAARERVETIVEGSNQDDNGDYRPGLQAVDELGVKSPLRTCNLDKMDIRVLSKKLGLTTWEKQSFACLSSRFVYGETISREKLFMVDRAEQLLLDMGFHQVRVRIHGNIARIEILPFEFEKILIDTCYCEALDIGKGGSAVDVVIIEFTDEGKEIMAEKTSKLIGEEINLVVKGNLLYDCKLEEAITDGKWVLTGIDDKEDLYKITEELNSVIN